MEKRLYTSIRTSRLEVFAATRECPCSLCKCMGSLAGMAGAGIGGAFKTQIHPGLSGLEHMDLSRVNVQGCLAVDGKTRLGLNPADHVIGQSGAHVQIHIVSQRLDDVNLHL